MRKRKGICSGIHVAGFLLFACCLLLVIPNIPRAEVTGTCSNCHTMHNSQGGVTVNGQANPRDALLITDCIPCHTNSGSETIIVSESKPIPNNLISPTNPLAGGNFYDVDAGVGGHDRGHNVYGVDVQDTILSNPLLPPGGTALTQQLKCAGTDGCHGHNGLQSGDTAVDNQMGAIKGGHHGDDTPPLGGSLTDVAKNYRMLLGIAGREDNTAPAWEQDSLNTNHNAYRGDTSFSITNTVSYFCGECHGNSGAGGYHNSTGVGSASPWLRHPTDYAVPSSGEYTGYTSYSMTTPVARQDPEAAGSQGSTVTLGSDTIMCLSCHRAHASPYYKAVRWAYKSTALATAISGCSTCHTAKN